MQPAWQGTLARRVAGSPLLGIGPRSMFFCSPSASSSWSCRWAAESLATRNRSGVASSEIAFPVRPSRRPVGTRSCDHGTAAGSASGSSATRPKASGSTASVVRNDLSPVSRTTGVACPPPAPASACTALATFVPVRSATIGAPLSRSAASSRFRPPTLTAYVENTSSAEATVTTVTTRRVAGRRATASSASAPAYAPRAVSRRPSQVATGTIRYASSRPAISASRAGAAAASGPVRLPVANASTAVPAAAITTASTAPSPQPRCRVGTVRSSAEIPSRVPAAAAAQVSAVSSKAAPATASQNPVPSSNGAAPSSTVRRATVASPSPTAVPTGTPTSTTGSSSDSTSRRPPPRPAPRSRATATSGRRCSTAAPSVRPSTNSASRPSWIISSGTVTSACRRPRSMVAPISGKRDCTSASTASVGLIDCPRSSTSTALRSAMSVTIAPARSIRSTSTVRRSRL